MLEFIVSREEILFNAVDRLDLLFERSSLMTNSKTTHLNNKLYLSCLIATILFLTSRFTGLVHAEDLQKSTKQENTVEKSSTDNKSNPEASNKTESNVSDSDTKTEKARYKVPKVKELPVLSGSSLVIPIHGTIDLGLPHYIQRSIDEHPEAQSIILEVDTLGGRVDAAIKIRDILLGENRPIIAYIYRRAISAGALISYAADYIVFSPGSTMGAATPIQMDQGQAKAVGEKMVSYFRSEMRATAEAKGRDGELAESMVDSDKVVPEVSVKGKLLTLTNDMAVKFGVANAVIDSPKELFTTLGLSESQSIRAEESWSENIARAVTDPTLSGLLMSLGMLGIVVELYTPGVGFAGILGFLSLLLFFLGHKIAGLAGSEELLAIIVGIAFLAAEIFVIPGFGIAGIIGIIFMAMGLVTSMGELPEGISWDYGHFQDPFRVFLYALGITILFAIIIAKYLPRSSFGSWLVLNEDLGKNTPKQEEISDGSALELSVKVDDIGVATTPLRLSGKARFNSEIIDVVSQVDYLEKDQKLKIIDVRGSRVVVIAITDEEV